MAMAMERGVSGAFLFVFFLGNGKMGWESRYHSTALLQEYFYFVAALRGRAAYWMQFAERIEVSISNKVCM